MNNNDFIQMLAVLVKLFLLISVTEKLLLIKQNDTSTRLLEGLRMKVHFHKKITF